MKQLAKRVISILGTVLISSMIFSGCAADKAGNSQADSQLPPTLEKVDIPLEAKAVVRVGALKGPTGMGLVNLMQQSEQKQTSNIYDFEIAGAPMEIQGKLINGELDIAALPTNVGAVLYNKTEKDVKIIAVNTLGVLSLLSREEAIESVSDLKGKTIVTTGQGSTQEYVLDYILRKNDLDPAKDVTIEFMAEHAELASAITAGKVDFALLPQPFVTTVTSKSPEIKVVLDITDEWERVAGGTSLPMGCLVVRNDFLQRNQAAVDRFLEEYAESAAYANANVEETATLVGKYEMIPEEIARLAIPKSNIVYLAGDEMRQSVEAYLEILFQADPKSVGGNLPDEGFYYNEEPLA